MSFCLDRTCLPFQDPTLTLDVCMGLFTQFIPLFIDLHYLVFFSILFGIIFIQTAGFMFASTSVGAGVHLKGLGITILLFGFRSYVTQFTSVMADIELLIFKYFDLHVVIFADIFGICACFAFFRMLPKAFWCFSRTGIRVL